jgi:hypothetical protein
MSYQFEVEIDSLDDHHSDASGTNIKSLNSSKFPHGSDESSKNVRYALLRFNTNKIHLGIRIM